MGCNKTNINPNRERKKERERERERAWLTMAAKCEYIAMREAISKVMFKNSPEK